MRPSMLRYGVYLQYAELHNLARLFLLFGNIQGFLQCEVVTHLDYTVA